MPYEGANDGSLPKYIIGQDPAIRARWVTIFNSVHSTQGEEMAFIVANKWLKRQSGVKKELRAQTSRSLVRVEFKVDKTKELIKQTEGGDDYIDFVLVDDLTDNKGNTYPESLLKEWTEGINKNNTIVGDVDHAYYDKLIESGMSTEDIQKEFKNKKGIAKSVRAVYEKGKLWVRTMIDKRYKRIIEKAKGVSLEALIERDEQNNIVDGNLLGFTFGVLDTPVNPRAVIV